ncbi:MAG: Asp-tRNA(Asn)/Glu-tRNA(Gln) amidotransferase subunit GatC [Planctomycetes bacterium]|nr:Asp-tRNA(Asn)/Glu-tRNA(Gln) amidotransferase subunit GatC [Planctomycetota bacterium]
MTQTEVDIVKKTATLARLELGEAEIAKFGEQFGRILEAFQKLSKLDVSGVEPMTGATALSDVLRDDRAKPSLERERALSNGPKHDGEYFIVPKTIGGDA